MAINQRGGKRGLVRVFDKLDGFRDARRLILPALEDANIPLLLEEAVPQTSAYHERGSPKRESLRSAEIPGDIL